MSVPVEQDWVIYSGDSWQFTATFFQDDEKTTPLVIDGADEITLEIRADRKTTDILGEAGLGTGLEVTNNVLEVNIPGDVIKLGAKTYQYDVESRTGTEVMTLLSGKVQVLADVVKDK